MELLKLENMGKEIVVNEDTVRIHQKVMKTDKVIPFSNIVSVQVKKPGLLAGYIYFQTIGGLGNKVKTPGDISKDENALMISGKGKYELALKMKERIEGYSMKRSDAVRQLSSADEILKYKKLLDDGIITQEEFEAKKKELLNL